MKHPRLKVVAGAAIVIGILTAQSCDPNPPHTDCAADPGDCGYPDATSTGPTGSLTTVDPSPAIFTRLETDNEVVENKAFIGSVFVDADNVTIKNSSVTNHSEFNFAVIAMDPEASDLTIENVEIDGNSLAGYGVAAGPGTEVLRTEIREVTDGVTTGASSVKVDDSFIHSLSADPELEPNPHYDGVQTDGNQASVSVTNNTILVPQGENSGGNAAVYLTNGSGGGFNNGLVFNNLLAGGVYTVFLSDAFDEDPVTNVTVAGNLIREGDFGHYVLDLDPIESSIHVGDNKSDNDGSDLPEQNPDPCWDNPSGQGGCP